VGRGSTRYPSDPASASPTASVSRCSTASSRLRWLRVPARGVVVLSDALPVLTEKQLKPGERQSRRDVWHADFDAFGQPLPSSGFFARSVDLNVTGE